MSKPIVLVTGASGFLATHVVSLLLKEGYAVRGTARSGRIDSLRAAAIGSNPDFSLVQVDDIATSDLTEAMKDVEAVMHVASPLAGQGDAHKMIQTARGGVLHVLEAAHTAGISKVVVTSSSGTVMEFDQAYKNCIISGNNIKKVSEEEALNMDPSDAINIYMASKILAEEAAWQFVKEHPAIDLITIHPPAILGPIENQFPRAETSRLGANIMIHLLLEGDPGRPLPDWLVRPLLPHFCDVRDVAKAHVLALKAGHSSEKKFLLCGGYFSWKEAVQHIATVMPELSARLPNIDGTPDLPNELATFDVEPAVQELGMKSFITWQVMLEDTVKSLLAQ